MCVQKDMLATLCSYICSAGTEGAGETGEDEEDTEERNLHHLEEEEEQLLQGPQGTGVCACANIYFRVLIMA